jgi:predicted dehydrogenase
VVLATQDRDHLEPALALMEHGYDILLEKPMATTAEDCRRLQQASRHHQRLLVVAHVLRYTPYFRQLKRVVESGVLGQLVTVRHLEPVNYWHQAHSFVRGNWRNSGQSAPMILAKSCHDLDMICHLVGEDPVAVASFGSLAHFRPSRRPPQASDRCLDCSLADAGCAYSAKRYYLGLLNQGQLGWPLDVLTSDTSFEGVSQALREGPYGRCVYACDNDVVDHQVVALEFASGVSATFTMTAFTTERWRETELLGSHGQLLGDGRCLRLQTFGGDPEQVWDFSHVPSHGHGGGDDGLMEFFHECLENRQQALARPLAEEALRGHILCFAAEQSRLERRVVEISL